MSSHINPSLQKVIVGLVVGAAVGATVQTAPSSSPSLQSFSPSHSVSSDMHRPLVHRNSPSPASAQVGAEEGVKLGWPVGAAVGTVVGAAVPGEAVGAPVGDLVERQILAASSEPSPQSDSSSQRRVASMHSPDEQRNSPSPAAEQVGDAVGVDVGTELLGPVVGTVVGAVDGREVEGAAVGPADGAAEHKLIASSLPSPQSCKCQDRLGDSGFNDAEPDSCNVIMAKSQEHRMHCGHGWSVDTHAQPTFSPSHSTSVETHCPLLHRCWFSPAASQVGAPDGDVDGDGVTGDNVGAAEHSASRSSEPSVQWLVPSQTLRERTQPELSMHVNAVTGHAGAGDGDPV